MRNQFCLPSRSWLHLIINLSFKLFDLPLFFHHIYYVLLKFYHISNPLILFFFLFHLVLFFFFFKCFSYFNDNMFVLIYRIRLNCFFFLFFRNNNWFLSFSWGYLNIIDLYPFSFESICLKVLTVTRISFILSSPMKLEWFNIRGIWI